MQPQLFHVHALSALHCGVGQSAGVVDLPIARARATHLPIIPGSSIRGVLRAHFEEKDRALATTLFGPRTIAAAEAIFAGALAVGDASLLLLPVRSLAGILCYVTSPFVLQRYAQERKLAGLTSPAIPSLTGKEIAQVTTTSVNRMDGKLILEDLDIEANPAIALDEWAKLIAQAIFPSDESSRSDLSSRLALLPDSIFSFLAETATELRTRIAIDPQTGTVKRGALWFEENLPAEAVLWGVYALSEANDSSGRTAAELTAQLSGEELLQLGGHAGVGRGLVRLLTEVDHG